jgi:prepilin-type N-terminal cleavage/methylation domain-containing protein
MVRVLPRRRPPRALPPGPALRQPRCGFTLLELLVVMTLIAALLGLGIGFLTRGDTELERARAIVRDQVRLAATTAKARSAPTEVLVAHESDGTTTVQARVLRPIGYWHLEPDAGVPSLLQPVQTGTSVAGRFGFGRRPDAEQGATMFSVRADDPYFDVSRGFLLRVDVKLDATATAVLARLGRSFELGWDSQLVPQALVTLRQSERSGQTLRVAGKVPLPLQRWVTLQLVHDGRALVLDVDGIEVARVAAAGETWQEKDPPLEVSPGDTPVRGTIDEIHWYAYEYGSQQVLPAEVQLLDLQVPIRFGRAGELLAPVRFTLASGDLRVGARVQPGGIVEWVEP